tara:strand:+ start:6572 stop:7162 length:591 start_codon:yes stop_codon:yes gene_type:complete
MLGVSSKKNDDFIVKQFCRTRRPSDCLEVNFNQLRGCVRLSEKQMKNLLGNYLRMGLYRNDGNDHERQRHATLFEEVCALWVDRFGVGYSTDECLKQKNRDRQAEGLPALPTPDFLLDEAVVYEGEPVHWVECKNYYATTEPKVKRKLGFMKTADKYLKAYGSGLMVFRHGFNSDLCIPKGVRFIDFNSIANSASS